MDPAVSKTKNSLSLLVWVLLIVLVGAVSGIGGYFLGKMDEKDNSSSQAPAQREPQTGVAEYCAKGWCITYDQAIWDLDPYTGQDTSGSNLAGGSTLKRPSTDSQFYPGQITFSTYVDGLGGYCGNEVQKCYSSIVDMEQHPHLTDHVLVKALNYMRDSGNAVYKVVPSLYVAEKSQIEDLGLKVGVEKALSLHAGLLFDTGKTYPDTKQPVKGWLYYDSHEEFESLQGGIKELKSTQKSNSSFQAYKVLSSLQKEV